MNFNDNNDNIYNDYNLRQHDRLIKLKLKLTNIR